MTADKQHIYVIGANRSLFAPASNIKRAKDSSDSAAGADIEHVETVDTISKVDSHGRLRATHAKLRKHWRRFWCCYLVAAIVFLAIFLPVFFLVVVPAIAQRIVDDTKLPVYSAQILDPKPDQVTFTLHTSLDVPLGLRIHTNPLNLSLFDRDVQPIDPYLIVSLPAYNLEGKTNMTVTQKNANILDKKQFVKTLATAVYNKRFTLSAKGSTVGHLGALHTSLTLNKDVELNGLDKLSGFAIDSVGLIPKAQDGSNVAGTATLPNHSVFTFALGNVTLNLRSSDLIIGQALIRNVVLRPGNNTVSLRGYLDVETVFAHLSEILAFQKSALANGDIQLSASGNSTIYNGVHIEYYEEVLNSLTLTTRVPILEVLGGTLQNFMESNDSAIGQAINSVLDNLSNLTDVPAAARSIRALF